MNNVRVIDRDLGWAARIREIQKMDKSVTKVGFPQDAEPVLAPGGEYSDMSELATIAAVHEFGAPNRGIPERSFLRSGIDENRTKLADIQTRQAQLVADGKRTVKDALGVIGEAAVAFVRRKITTGPFKELSKITIANRKRPSTKPLIDSGSLRQSVQHVEEVNG